MKGRRPGRSGDSAYLANWVFNQAMENLIRRGEIVYNSKTRVYSPGPNMRRPDEEKPKLETKGEKGNEN